MMQSLCGAMTAQPIGMTMIADPKSKSSHQEGDASKAAGHAVRFVPLGGLGEIGMNCFALEDAGEILVVDCGVAFPEDDLGVDVVVPDFSWLVERQERIRGVFITHGHEDHIGALPYLLRELDHEVPVYAPTHACALITSRFEEHRISTECLREVHPGESYAVGPFTVEPIPVAHSIIDATALCIETSVGRIVHTGDFDLDEHQPAGHPTDGERLARLGEEGVRLLLSDSTNVDREERSGSEDDVAMALRRVVLESPGRVVVGMFSSNIHRIRGLVDVARESGRRLCFLGRSLLRQSEAARSIGRLEIPSNLLVAAEDLVDLPRKQVLVIAGGSQAEPPSSLRRLSLGTHQYLSLSSGDAAILSARVIPGNERAVFTMQNDLLRQGVVVHSERTDPRLHTSGHASRSEQRQMIRWTKPRSFVPVHGTLHHLRNHERVAREEGIDDTLVVENGRVIEIGASSLRRAESIQSGQVQIAYGGEELDASTRRRRLDLARSGVVAIAAVLDDAERIVHGPTFTAYGVPTIDGDEEAQRLVCADARTALVAGGRRRPLPLEEVLRRAVRRTVYELSGVRVVVEVNLIRTH